MKIIILILTSLLLTSCNSNVEFDSQLWNQESVDWQFSDVRENMLSDLIEGDIIIGLNKTEVRNLLGKPEFYKPSEFWILVREKYASNIDPDYTEYLIIKFDENGVVNDYYSYRTK